MGKPKVVVIGDMDKSLLNMISKQSDLKIWDKADPIPRDMLFEWLEDAEGLISRGDVKVDDELLSNSTNLKVIAQSSVGFDNVDVHACTKHSIPFGNTPGVLVDATADLIYGLILSSARKIHEGWQYVKDGKWDSSFNIPFGVDLYGKTLGIIGMGNIGRAVAKRATVSGMNVIYNNRNRHKENEREGAEYTSFLDLLSNSDFVLSLVPLSNQSYKLFEEEEFKKMKTTSFFINASRGGIVDTKALYSALYNNEIAYAALDVIDPEPINKDHPILSLSNVLITPHIGSATYETRGKMASLTIDNLIAGLNEKKLITCVNEEANYSI